MVKFIGSIFILTFFIVVTSGFLSDGVKDFQFNKLKDDNSEYEFEYKLDNGEIFRGKAVLLFSSTYILFGAEDALYWVTFDDDDAKDEKPFTKTVRLVERGMNSIHFKDDSTSFEIDFQSGILETFPYNTEWDLQNICFTKVNTKEQTFHFIIKSKNNSRKYNGTTFYDMDDNLVQLFHLDDSNGTKRLYEVNFTENELNSNDSFCKGNTKLIWEYVAPMGVPPPQFINPQLIKSLVG